MRSTLIRLATAAVMALPLVATSGPAALAGGPPLTWRYPSVDCPQGPTGLQACVDLVGTGDTILLTAEILDEDVEIRRSLTLKPESSSLVPRLDTIFVGDGTSPGQAPDIEVHLAGIRVERVIRAAFSTGTGDRLTMDRMSVGKGAASPRGISLELTSPAAIEIRRTFSRTVQHQESPLSYTVAAPSGLFSLLLIGNEFTSAGSLDSGAGVDLAAGNNVTLDLRLYSNVIHDVVQDNAGAAAGITLVLDDTVSARLRIAGNTIDGVGSNGIYVRDDLVAPGHVDIDVVGNVISHVLGSGIRIDPQNPGTATVRAGWNAFYKTTGANGYGGGSAGPGVITGKDPRYVKPSANDFRLQAGSPLIDAGQACSPAGIARLDRAGKARWAGRGVDIGAYERGATPQMGVVKLGDGGPDTLTGTSGRDILCGLGGQDRLTGGGGPDLSDGGAANDVLCARDGSGGDVLLGGPGSDKARRDTGDSATSVESFSASC